MAQDISLSSLELQKPTIGFPEVLPVIKLPTSLAIRVTASKSPSEATGNPASQTSTPSLERALAISNFSSIESVTPGD